MSPAEEYAEAVMRAAGLEFRHCSPYTRKRITDEIQTVIDNRNREMAGRLQVLENALKPFADAAYKADEDEELRKRLNMGGLSDGASTGWGITYGHVKRARDVLATSFAGIPIHVDTSLKPDEAWLVDNVTGQRFRLVPVEGQANG